MCSLRALLATSVSSVIITTRAPVLKSLVLGSHVVYVLQKTRLYKVISLDNNHNSNSTALDRVSQLSKSELPADASEDDKLSTEIDKHKCDLTQPDQIRAVFAKYGKGGIWGVIHIAVCLCRLYLIAKSNRSL